MSGHPEGSFGAIEAIFGIPIMSRDMALGAGVTSSNLKTSVNVTSVEVRITMLMGPLVKHLPCNGSNLLLMDLLERSSTVVKYWPRKGSNLQRFVSEILRLSDFVVKVFQDSQCFSSFIDDSISLGFGFNGNFVSGACFFQQPVEKLLESNRLFVDLRSSPDFFTGGRMMKGRQTDSLK